MPIFYWHEYDAVHLLSADNLFRDCVLHSEQITENDEKRLTTSSLGHMCNEDTFLTITGTNCVQRISVQVIERWKDVPGYQILQARYIPRTNHELKLYIQVRTNPESILKQSFVDTLLFWLGFHRAQLLCVLGSQGWIASGYVQHRFTSVHNYSFRLRATWASAESIMPAGKLYMLDSYLLGTSSPLTHLHQNSLHTVRSYDS